MNGDYKKLDELKQKLDAPQDALQVVADFVKNYPFTDGHGRASRLLLNLELMKAGFGQYQRLGGEP